MPESIPSDRIHSVNKIGGKNMSKPEDVGRLVQTLSDRGEAATYVMSAFTKVTNELYAAMDKLNGQYFCNDRMMNAGFEPVQAIHHDFIDKHIEKKRQSEARALYTRAFMWLKHDLQMHRSRVTTILAPGEDTYKIRDQVIGFGEHMSPALMAIYLQQLGFKVNHIQGVQALGEVQVNGQISVDKLHESMREGIQASVKPSIDETREGVIRLIGGHISGTPHGIAVDVGRSYTDTTAVNTAFALRDAGEPIEVIRYWKDVDAVMTANPKDLDPKKNRARPIPEMSFTEGLEAATGGSQLVHIDALAMARSEEERTDSYKQMRIELSNIERPEEEAGTVFSNKEKTSEKPFKCIASNKHVDTITVTIPAMANRKGFLSAISDVLERNGLSIDTFTTEGTSIFCSVDLPQDDADKTEMRKAIETACKEMDSLTVGGENYSIPEGAIEWRENLASLSIVGNELVDKQGALTWITSILAAHDINIEVISHTTNQKRVTIFVDERQLKNAVQAIHSVLVDGNQDDIQYLVDRRVSALKALSQAFQKRDSLPPVATDVLNRD
jgi:aspartate kinase